MEFLKKSITKIWEGFLQNIGVLITAFIISGGYLVAINKLKEFQTTIRGIPSDYFLTPLVLLLIVFGVLLKINRNQQDQLSKLKQVPEKDEKEARFVTHLGVWWKIYPDSEYIEDFPYCACCDPKLKLVQTEWHPDEIFKCPKTNTEYKLYDNVPRKKEQVLQSLYSVYFHGLPNQFHKEYLAEVRRKKELDPDVPEAEITKLIFEMKPLSFIPTEERQEIINKHPNPMQAFHFIERHYDSYKKYLKKKHDNEQK
ncbi:MAG: hypothetical protein NPIRA03_37960 [Nitrospirales bacterium]|nr:MAG: hypothetical protein NPIRA03_37960 [Nitrospirales bacterium]